MPRNPNRILLSEPSTEPVPIRKTLVLLSNPLSILLVYIDCSFLSSSVYLYAMWYKGERALTITFLVRNLLITNAPYEDTIVFNGRVVLSDIEGFGMNLLRMISQDFQILS